MGLKAAVQALKKAEELKAKVSRHNDLLNNSEVWSDHQQLQTVYHQVLVLDLEYALDKKVEQELWTLGFKNHIAALQHLSRDKKNPRRSECQALLSWCLEAASGFYLTLLQELCSAFELDLPFRRRSAIYGQSKTLSNSEQLVQPHKSSCLYICQYCLVHLGDIARYRSQRKQAESFYRHAILLSPSSGQPYNQLALLEASRGDKLATVFHYVRSIAVKHPFPAAATNLSNTLSAVLDNDEPLTETTSKLSLTEFIALFLRAHGLLLVGAEHEQADIAIRSLNATLTALVATGTFSTTRLTQMTAINLYALRHATDNGNSGSQLSQDELKVKNQVLNLLAGAFSAYLLPIYTMSVDATLLDYCALPAIKLTMDWIKTDPKVLKESVFTKRLQIWPSLCKLLNSLQGIVGDIANKNIDKIPLPEDRELQCFLPLINAFKDLDFVSENLNQDFSYLNKVRVARLVNLGLWLSTQTVDNNVLITAKRIKNPDSVVFEPSNKQPDPTTELLEELKHFNIKDNFIKEMKKSPIRGGEKQRGGILKPQGSLEKAREEREQQALLLTTETGDSSSNASLSSSSISSIRSDITTAKLKRNRQNIAMQTLVKKVEENNKQVTFLTEPKVVSTITKSNKQDKLSTIVNTHKPQPLDIQKQSLPGLSNKNSESILQSEPIRIPQQIIPPLLTSNSTDIQIIKPQGSLPLPYNQNQNYPRNVSQFSVPFQNNSSNLSFHNSLPPQSTEIVNMQYQRPQQPNLSSLFNTNLNQFSQNQGFNVPFEMNNQTQQSQSVNYQPVPLKDQFSQFSTWTRDEKLPMPPSTWWTNNQKSLLRTFPNTSQNDLFNPNNFYNFNNVNSNSNNVGFLPDNLGFDRQHNSNSGIYSNMSTWNSGNVHQMIINKSPQSIIPTATQTTNQPFGDLTKISNMPSRENKSMNVHETTDTKTNSPVPGYSLFNSNWAPALPVHSVLNNSPPDRPSLIRQQSLFSGPGPSPLERLLEQQKQLRGPHKEDT